MKSVVDLCTSNPCTTPINIKNIFIYQKIINYLVILDGLEKSLVPRYITTPLDNVADYHRVPF